MKRLNIVKVIDQWGWAYHFLDKEQQKYSRHNIIIQKYNDVCLDNVDMLYIHGPDISIATTNELTLRAHERGIKVIGGYGGYTVLKYPFVDAVVTIAPESYEFAKMNYDKPVIFLPESIDTDFFKFRIVDKSSFRIGFAARLSDVKRPYLLNRLKYEVVRKSDWGPQFFTQDRTLEPMLKFYNQMDVILLMSKSECMPRCVLEAMSCGLSVIATNVGCVRMLLDSMWIVDAQPDEAVVQQINNRLSRLVRDPELRQAIGRRNRYHVEKFFSWKNTIKYWDLAFDYLHSGENDKAIDASVAFQIYSGQQL